MIASVVLGLIVDDTIHLLHRYTSERAAGHAPLDAFWRKRGYAPVPGFVTELAWKEHGEAEESPKPMQYWMRRL